MNHKKHLLAVALAAACAGAGAKIPAPVLDDAAKAKAAEAAAKTAWQGKVDNYLLCKSQDKVAAHYRKTSGGAQATAVVAKPADMKAAAKPADPKAAVAAPAAAGGAPVGTCADPGPFAYAPPDQKPLEASGAHSPPGTAASPPSTKAPAASIPAKKS
jgi:hypothetical protein